MARKKKKAANRRRKQTSRRPFVALLLVTGLLICGALYFLERLKVAAPEKTVAKTRTEERQKMPPRTAQPGGAMENYSATVHPVPGTVPVKKRPKAGHGTIAIIIDDMGNSRHEADSLLQIDVPMTFSIIPGLANVKEVAEAAHRKGREVMVHIPMEPKGVGNKPFEKNGLLLDMSDEEILKRLGGYLGSVPYAVGANNHMGSRFTEDRAKMHTVLNALKGKKMYFIDSKTTPASVGDKLAREMGIPTASRNVFLDNVQDVPAIRSQIEKLADMAKRTGSAIGICHPHRATIQALAMTLPVLRSEGITFVYASDMVR